MLLVGCVRQSQQDGMWLRGLCRCNHIFKESDVVLGGAISVEKGSCSSIRQDSNNHSLHLGDPIPS